MKEMRLTVFCRRLFLILALCVGAAGMLVPHIPDGTLRILLLAFCGLILAAAILWAFGQNRMLTDFSNDICETVDMLMEGREPENVHPYEETSLSRVQGKLLQYYEKMKEEQRQSLADKQTIQELVSDISRHINISEGTIYPLLKRLKDDGLFTTYLQESSEGPPRKYYAISDRGRAYKEELAGEWRDFSAKVNHIIDGTDAGEKGMTPS